MTDTADVDLGVLADFVGRWQGVGVGGYPTIESFHYQQEVEFTAYGKPVLAYTSRTWSMDDGRPLAYESGFWRVLPDRQVELTLAHASGIVEILYGEIGEDGRVELGSDILARSTTAKDVRATTRLYAIRGGELVYAMDMAYAEHPLTAHVSARLRRPIDDESLADGLVLGEVAAPNAAGSEAQ